MTSPESDHNSAPSRPGDILLVRHGKPEQDRKLSFDADGWTAWWLTYEDAGLVEGQEPPQRLLEEARTAVHLFASSRRRAMDTAGLLFEGRPFTTDDVFVEAPLPAPPMPRWFKLSPWVWGTFSRIVWVLGYSGAGESHTLAMKRAGRAADLLIHTASDGGRVVMCGHGWFNRMIRRQLKARGWVCRYDGGDKYWSYRRFSDAKRD